MLVCVLLLLLSITFKSEGGKRSQVDKDLWTSCSLTCGGGVQQRKSNVSVTRACNTIACAEDAGCVCVKLSFDTLMDTNKVYDVSHTRNIGTLHDKAKLAENGKNGKCLDLQEGGYVTFDAENFHNRPGTALSIATWVKLPQLSGTRTIFYSSGNDKGYNQGEYILELMDGYVRWIHTDAKKTVVFLLASKSQIDCGIWVHIMVTYKGPEGEAKLYVDGKDNLSPPVYVPKDTSLNQIAMDWSKAIIGVFGQNVNPLKGFVDDFQIFKCAVSKEQVNELFTNGKIKKFEIPYYD